MRARLDQFERIESAAVYVRVRTRLVLPARQFIALDGAKRWGVGRRIDALIDGLLADEARARCVAGRRSLGR